MRAANPPAKRALFVLGLFWLLLAAAIIAIQLASRPSITVAWQTETEVETAGFNIYRALSPEGPFQRLNDELIPGRGSASSGSSYTYTDAEVTPRRTYFYQIEDVELDNSATRHEVVGETAPARSLWLFAVAALCLLFGAALLRKGTG